MSRRDSKPDLRDHITARALEVLQRARVSPHADAGLVDIVIERTLGWSGYSWRGWEFVAQCKLVAAVIKLMPAAELGEVLAGIEEADAFITSFEREQAVAA